MRDLITESPFIVNGVVLGGGIFLGDTMGTRCAMDDSHRIEIANWWKRGINKIITRDTALYYRRISAEPKSNQPPEMKHVVIHIPENR